MTISAKIRIVTDGVSRALGRRLPETQRPEASGDGHAPGHRHLSPPPKQAKPEVIDLEPPKDKPWVRTTHSDSQQRRFRR